MRAGGTGLALALVAVFLGTNADAQRPDGEALYQAHCVHCHAPGDEHPGYRQLRLTRGPDRAVLTERSDLEPAYIRAIVRGGLMSMPGFTPGSLSDTDLEALVGFLAN